MKNFDIDLTDAEKVSIINRWNATSGAANTEQLRNMIRDLYNIVLNDMQYTFEERYNARAINSTTGKPNEPEYTHEYNMLHDNDYYAAWAYDHSESFRSMAESRSKTMAAVLRGKSKYTYFETDPDIVDRSLLRNQLRDKEEGEEDPPDVLGQHAPSVLISVPRIVQGTTISTVGSF